MQYEFFVKLASELSAPKAAWFTNIVIRSHMREALNCRVISATLEIARRELNRSRLGRHCDFIRL